MKIRSLLHYEIIKRNVYTKANWVTIIRGLLRYEMMKSNVYTKAKKQKYVFTLKATGRVLLHLQCDGRTEHRKFGLSVRTSSPA